MRFETTSWSLILEANAASSTVAREGLARLLETYWPPVYAFIRRKGHSAVEAEDLTQGYFTRFLEKDYIADFRERLRLEPVDRLTPEVVFERQWAASVLGRCLEVLRQERAAAEGRDRFERLKPFLAGEEKGAGYAAVARELGLTESAVRVAVHRLRKRFSAVLREEVGRTVRSSADVDAEIRWMLEALRGSQ